MKIACCHDGIIRAWPKATPEQQFKIASALAIFTDELLRQCGTSVSKLRGQQRDSTRGKRVLSQSVRT